jgi:2-oxoglutarate ferredoxin oxidoreductase subunit gamma
VPANDIAEDLGSTKAANIVALAAFVARSKIVDFEILRQCVKKVFSSRENLISLNLKALEQGKKVAQIN